MVTCMFWTVSLLPMERLGSVVYGLLQHMSPQITGVERGGGQRQHPVYTGIVVNNFHFNFMIGLSTFLNGL
jgi:hypothetical protein